MSKKDAATGITMGEMINLWNEVERDYNVKIVVTNELKHEKDKPTRLKLMVKAVVAGIEPNPPAIETQMALWPTNTHKTYCGALYYLTIGLVDQLDAMRAIGSEDRPAF